MGLELLEHEQCLVDNQIADMLKVKQEVKKVVDEAEAAVARHADWSGEVPPDGCQTPAQLPGDRPLQPTATRAEFPRMINHIEQAARQAELDRLYEADGRHDPHHPMHCLYTGLLTTTTQQETTDGDD